MTLAVAVGSTTPDGGAQSCHLAAYRPNGTLFGLSTLASAFSDHLSAVAADAFGGFYFTGTFHRAADDRKIATWRSSTLASAGNWRSYWSMVASEDNSAAAIAVRGTTASIAGPYNTGGPSGLDQVLLTYVY